jgi:voltage-gated potassium channel
VSKIGENERGKNPSAEGKERHEMDVARHEQAIIRWERASAVPLAALAAAFIGLWAMQVLANLSPLGYDLVEAALLVIWFAFIIDFLVRLRFHRDKRAFLKSNIVEILAIAVPAFRFLRVLRILMAIGILTRVVQSLQGRVNIYIAIVLPLITFAGALGVLEAERHAAGANITNFPDALWWACVTIFTVGYGDLSPITFEGRAIAVILMMSGVAMISVVTANLATYFLANQQRSTR